MPTGIQRKHGNRCDETVLIAVILQPDGGLMTPKKVVQELLEALPDSCSYDDIKRHIELFEKIRTDQEAVMMGAKASLQIERHPEQ